MWRLSCAALVAAALALPSPPAHALEVERSATPIGERPSALGETSLGSSRWSPASLPASTFVPRTEGGSLSSSGGGTLPSSAGGSSFRLDEVPSRLRERTRTLLGEFGARDEADGRIRITLLGDVLFDFDKSEVRPDARPVLNRLAELLAGYRQAAVAIEGHTDAKGDDDYNQALSERRAAAVKAYLAQRNAGAARLSTRGFGESRPVAPNTTPDGADDPEGRQRNRRVEFVIGPGTR
ncbi:OmpA family protein [Phreatobacter sp. AB_2022a]|uniref:OmpA family protein n=1 Tax=Phreatobacter sp. AB_2022a TaxID=3003134 RepID=UPI002286E119|nr:OmpA family protein [Phreatobacter sp. AB_2022a]MCZ0734281.1 OmpA family protein [Phreatobacter sp. AB_2022a]